MSARTAAGQLAAAAQELSWTGAAKPRFDDMAYSVERSLSLPLVRPQMAYLDALRWRLRAAAGDGSWENISPVDWEHAAWVLWEGPSGLDAEPGLMDRYTTALSALGSSLGYRALILCYLQRYDPSLPYMEEAAVAIRAAVADPDVKGLAFWRKSEERFGTFDFEHGPERIAGALILGPEPPAEIVAAAGLAPRPAPEWRFVRAVRICFFGAVQELAATDDLTSSQLGRVLEYFGQSSGQVLAENQREVATALLSPFRNGTEESDEARRLIVGFLVGLVGEPRENSAFWARVEAPLVAQMTRWIGDLRIMQFYRLVPSSRAEQRRSLWIRYAKQGRIKNAWVALYRTIETEIEPEPFGPLACGRLSGFLGRFFFRALLLIEVDGVIIAEVAPSGRCYAWPVGDNNAPRFHGSAYSPRDIRKGSVDVGSRNWVQRLGKTHGQDGRWPPEILGELELLKEPWRAAPGPTFQWIAKSLGKLIPDFKDRPSKSNGSP